MVGRCVMPFEVDKFFFIIKIALQLRLLLQNTKHHTSEWKYVSVWTNRRHLNIKGEQKKQTKETKKN